MIKIENNSVTATSKEGKSKSVDLGGWLDKVTQKDTHQILPDGVKCVVRRGESFIMVHQSPPALRNLKWITKDSPSPYGAGAKYRNVTLALPYVITFATFSPVPNGGHRLTGWNECFFSNNALTTMEDEVCFPALLNMSKWPDPGPNATSAWICTQHLDYNSLLLEPDPNKRTIKGLNSLVRCLFDSGFNYSSERHEGNSWFTASKDNDKRIATVEAWEKNTEKNPMFVLEIPWTKCPKNVSQIVDQVFDKNGITAQKVTTAADLERYVFNTR